MRAEHFKFRLMKIIKELNDPENSISGELMDIISEEVNIYHQELEIQNEELRRIQRELEKQHNYFYSIFDEAPVGYAICKLDGIITKPNTTLTDLLDLDISDVLNHNICEFIAEDHQDEFYFFIKKLNSDKDHQTQVFEFKTGSGPINLKIFANTQTDTDLKFIRMAFVQDS